MFGKLVSFLVYETAVWDSVKSAVDVCCESFKKNHPQEDAEALSIALQGVSRKFLSEGKVEEAFYVTQFMPCPEVNLEVLRLASISVVISREKDVPKIKRLISFITQLPVKDRYAFDTGVSFDLIEALALDYDLFDQVMDLVFVVKDDDSKVHLLKNILWRVCMTRVRRREISDDQRRDLALRIFEVSKKINCTVNSFKDFLMEDLVSIFSQHSETIEAAFACACSIRSEGLKMSSFRTILNGFSSVNVTDNQVQDWTVRLVDEVANAQDKGYEKDFLCSDLVPRLIKMFDVSSEKTRFLECAILCATVIDSESDQSDAWFEIISHVRRDGDLEKAFELCSKVKRQQDVQLQYKWLIEAWVERKNLVQAQQVIKFVTDSKYYEMLNKLISTIQI